MLGAAKPPTAKVPVVLDPFAASSFLGVLAGALNADNVLKGGRCSPTWSASRSVRRPSRCSTTDAGRRAGRVSVRRRGRAERTDRAVHRRRANGFLHATYTAHRAGNGQRSTGNAKRGGYKSRARRRHVELLRRGGGAGPSTRCWPRPRAACSSWTSAGCTPARTRSAASSASARPAGGSAPRVARGAAPRDDDRVDAARDAPGVRAVGSDLRFFSSVGTPSILIGEMTLAGV